ncbi:MAG TPA: phosphate ABC transporter permease PstA [Gemmatimonadales bacterium]
MSAPTMQPPPRTVPPTRATRSQRAAAERTVRTLRRRRIVSRIMVGVMYLAAILTTLPLLLILFHLIREGASALSLDFFTELPPAIGREGGGLGNAVVGTLILVGLASLIGLPVGVGAGLYLAEHRSTRLATATRFLADVLNGLPSIVMGIFAWQFLVRPLGGFSAISAGVALGAMMIPLVTRATEEMIRLVPVSLREAALALGYSHARTSLTIVLRTALPGIVTGALVAVARIAGETAPLLFTALGNQFWSFALDEPIDALPLRIFYYATTPFDELNRLAWAGALVLIGLVLVISLGARYVTRSRFGSGGD